MPTNEQYLKKELDKLYKRLLKQEQQVIQTRNMIRVIDNTINDPDQLSRLDQQTD